MRCGLYGKLPIKRDFIAEAVPRGFLPVFEPWLQGAVGASRLALGSRWQDIYFRAPLWRFWLGDSYCGRSAMGVMMPSVDGVGRCFPLILIAMADEGRAFAPPYHNAQPDWFAGAEDFLLATLDEGAVFTEIATRLEALPPPLDETIDRPASNVLTLTNGTQVLPYTDGNPQLGFARLVAADADASGQFGTFWWTIGGENMGALAMMCRQLPDASLFAGFLTGQFDGAGSPIES